MNYKNLVLDRTLIEKALNSFDESLRVSVISNKESEIRYETYYEGSPKALLIIYFNSNGKTTIQTSSGKNIELGDKLASRIIENCQFPVVPNGMFTIKPLAQDSFELLLEYLQEECFATILSTKEIVGGKQCIVKGKQGEKATLSYYIKKNTFMIQGCPLMLHSQVVEFLSEILDLDQLVDAQLKLIKTDITSAQVLHDLDAHLPRANAFIGHTLKAILSPCLAMKKLDIELTDYSVLVYPALKGLEGYIKSLFYAKGLTVGREGFAPYLNDSYHATLNDSTRADLKCNKTCTAINQCYSYYKDNRHGLFHVDGMIQNTRLIECRSEANSIVTEILSLIDNTYAEVSS